MLSWACMVHTSVNVFPCIYSSYIYIHIHSTTKQDDWILQCSIAAFLSSHWGTIYILLISHRPILVSSTWLVWSNGGMIMVKSVVFSVLVCICKVYCLNRRNTPEFFHVLFHLLTDFFPFIQFSVVVKKATYYYVITA